MIAGFSVFLIVMDNIVRPPLSCKKGNSMTFRINENVLDSRTRFPGMLTVFCNGQKGMYKVGRECKASIFVVIIFEGSSPFYGKNLLTRSLLWTLVHDHLNIMTIKEKLLGGHLFLKNKSIIMEILLFHMLKVPMIWMPGTP